MVFILINICCNTSAIELVLLKATSVLGSILDTSI